MRWSSAHGALCGALVLAGCPSEPQCEEGQELVDGECVAIETDETDIPSDTDETDLPDAVVAAMSVEWDVELLPNDNTLTVFCDGREVFTESLFTARRTYATTFEATAGWVCEVRMSDARGGNIAGGRLYNCSTEVASWETRRTAEELVVASATAFGCVEGCPDPIALNYDPRANLDNGTCEYIYGCTDERAFNYNAAATRDDGTCDFGGFGVIDVTVVTDAFPADTAMAVVCDGFEVLSDDSFPTANATYNYSVLVDAGFDCAVIISDAVGDEGAGGSVTVCGSEIARWRKTGQAGGVGGTLAAYEEVVSSFFMTACSGCTNPFSPEYDETALVDDGTCTIAN